jgi:hypothetical protein
MARPILRARRFQNPQRRAAIAICAMALAPTRALGGAWTSAPGEGQIIATALGWSGLAAPWGGVKGPRESRVEAQVYGEYGVFDRLTLFGEISPERYALSPPSKDVYTGLDYTQLGMRLKLWSNDDWAFSVEGSGFIPGARQGSRPAQAGDTGGAAEARGLLGRNFTFLGTPGFIDAEVGYRVRVGGPPDEWHGDVTIGLKWTPEWMGMLQVFNVISTRSPSPEFLTWRPDTVELSVVHALDAHWSLQLGGFATVSTWNTNSERGALISVWRKF